MDGFFDRSRNHLKIAFNLSPTYKSIQFHCFPFVYLYLFNLSLGSALIHINCMHILYIYT